MARYTPTRFNAATIFHQRGFVEMSHIVNLPQWEPLKENQNYTIGLLPLLDTEKAAPINNSGIWFRLRMSDRLFSVSEYGVRLDARVKELEKKSGHVTSKKDLSKIKADVREGLQKETPPKHTNVDVLLRDDWSIVCTSSSAVTDRVNKFLQKHLKESFVPVAAQLQGEAPFNEIASKILFSDDLVLSQFSLRDQVKYISKNKSQHSITHIGDMGISPEQHEVIKDECAVVQGIAVEWNGFRTKLTKAMAFSGVNDGFKVTKAMKAEQEGNSVEQANYDLSIQRAALFSTGVIQMMKDLAVHTDAGELAPLPVLEAQQESMSV